MKIAFRFVAISITVLLTFNACKKEKYVSDDDATLEFSEDTIHFDTVFTSVGSATQVFTVRNTYDQPLRITSINLAAASNSYFRLNVDGSPGQYFSDVEIGAHDSIWVFVEVTIDPNNGTTPLIVEDNINFITNGHLQSLPLVAYGQDAHFFPSSNCGEQRSQCTPLFKLKDCGGISTSLHWTNDKPYVIYGYAILDSGYTLTIDAGVRIHFHNNSGLIVLNSAKLIVNGTASDPVIFQGDRLGEVFQDIPGQWDRLWFSSITSIDISACPLENEDILSGPGPVGNVLNYAVIKNGFVGIQSDTLGSTTVPAVAMNNCIVKNFASTALYGNGSFVTANNCVFANCGEYLGFLPIGGGYRFLHCTFANYWNNSNRSTPSMLFNNYYVAANSSVQIRPITAYFGNCIVYGNQDTEIGYDTVTTGSYVDITFDHCLYRIDNDTYNGSAAYYVNSIKNVDPHFMDIDHNIFDFDSAFASSSPAVHTGDPAILILDPILGQDILQRPRPMPAGTNPDMGAYENQEN